MPGVGQQVLRARRVVLQLAVQLRQIDPQIVNLLRIRRSPFLFEQFLAAHDLLDTPRLTPSRRAQLRRELDDVRVALRRIEQ